MKLNRTLLFLNRYLPFTQFSGWADVTRFGDSARRDFHLEWLPICTASSYPF